MSDSEKLLLERASSIDETVEKIAGMQTRLEVESALAGEEKFRETIFDEFRKNSDPALHEKLIAKIQDLPSELLERSLALVVNFRDAAEFFANNGSLTSLRIAIFLNKFDDDKSRMPFLLSSQAGARFEKFDFATKMEFLTKAKDLADFEKSVLGAQFGETGASGN